MPALPSNLAAYKRVVGSAPAAGADWIVTVPTGKWWWLYSAYAVMTQGLTQTPQPILQFDDGTNLFMESMGSTAAQAASTTCAYTWGPGFVATGQVGTGTGVHSNAPIPDAVLLPAGFRIKTTTLGIGANSQWGVPALYVVEVG